MDEIKEIYEEDEKIKKICSFIKTTPFNNLKKSPHYEFSLLEKDTNEKELEKIYPQTDRIKLICLRRRKHRSGKMLENYDFHYFLDKYKRAVISINFNEEPPYLINGFFTYTNINDFKKKMMKRFRKIN
ncbi:MAG: hypothetical protein PF542_04500 [Nanoarchaeota archaeon]|jgi:hypothetical protein|nr:hypothetical protein [Nanoarchaeota archaeon]